MGDVVNDRDKPAIQVVHPWYRPHAEIIHSNQHIPVPYVRTAEVRPLIEGAIRVGVDLKPGRSEGLHDALAVVAGSQTRLHSNSVGPSSAGHRVRAVPKHRAGMCQSTTVDPEGDR